MATSTQNKAQQRDIDNTNVSPPSPAAASRGSIAARVTANIIDALNKGVRPWVKPWDSAAAFGLPLRHTGVAYKGVNILALWGAAQTHNYGARHWLTFKQALALGGAVRRGERGQHVVFYSGGGEGTDQHTDPPVAPKRAVLRAYVVFNAEQITGLPVHFYAPLLVRPIASETALAARFARVPVAIEHGGARACYSPARDAIAMPPRHAFVSTAQYYATLLHELAHWTGHPTRLDRDLQPHIATAAYAREELVAELTAAFLGAELGLPVDHVECHAAYIDSWLKLLDRDPSALLTAAGHAQRAADFLRAFLFGDTPAEAK